MVQFIKYLGVLLFTAVFLSILSIGWSRITDKKRPQFLNYINAYVKDTELGIKTKNVLGVTEVTEGDEIDIQKEAVILIDSAKSNVEDKAQEEMTKYTIKQIMRLYNTLPEAQRKFIKKDMCQSQ